MKTIYTGITSLGNVFMWPVAIPPPDDKSNEWWRTAREAAELAITCWVRLRADMNLSAYQTVRGVGCVVIVRAK
jgi:hypothetical protein